jgi:hypothetical protein
MAQITCPQCGTEFEEGPEFCPNVTCGYPVSFVKAPADEGESGLPRRPGEQVPTPPPPTLPVTRPQPTPIHTSSPPLDPEPDARSFPTGPVVAAIAGFVVIVVALVFVFRGGNTQAPSTSSTAASASATSNPAVDSISWTHLSDDSLSAPGAQQIKAVGITSLDVDWRMIAAGSTTFDPATGTTTEDGAEDAAIWLSTTGDHWEAVDSAELRGPDVQRINGITTFPRTVDGFGGIIAAGSDSSEGDTDASVWISNNGRDWVETSISAPGQQEIARIRYSKFGFTAVGWDGKGGDADGAVWSSDTGTAWSESTTNLGGPGDQYVSKVTPFTTHGRTELVAVGSSDETGAKTGAVWTWHEGSQWVRSPDPEGAFTGPGEEIRDVIAFEGRLIAVGFDSVGGDQNGAVWNSVDGQTWERVEMPDVMDGSGDQAIAKIIGVPRPSPSNLPLLVAGGYDTASGTGAGAGTSDAAVWYSNDGLVWLRDLTDEEALGGGGQQQIYNFAQLGPRLIAVGSSDFGGLDAAVWSGLGQA